MRLLLDTHVLLWVVEGAPDLRPRSRQLINRSARGDGVSVSAISFWEVAMLARGGRISLAQPASEWRRQVLALPGVEEEPIAGDVGIEAALLPGDLHQDPADRILAATARLRGHRLATHDVRLIRYGREGHLNVEPV